jgi:hypothetical protein
MSLESLSPKVAAVNRVNAAINKYAPIVVDAMRQLKGKAYLKTGDKSKQFDALVESLNLPKSPVRISILKSYNELYLRVSTYYATNHSDHNDCSDSFWIGKITSDGTIDLRIYKDENPTPLKTDYDALVIQEKRTEIAELERQVEAIRKAYDLYKFQGF